MGWLEDGWWTWAVEATICRVFSQWFTAFRTGVFLQWVDFFGMELFGLISYIPPRLLVNWDGLRFVLLI